MVGMAAGSVWLFAVYKDILSTKTWPIYLAGQNELFHFAFPIDHPAKRQCRVSQAPEDEPKLENHPQQASNGTTIEPMVGHIPLDRKRKKKTH
jgi:hypothetical protein